MTVWQLREWLESHITVQEVVIANVITFCAFGFALMKGWIK